MAADGALADALDQRILVLDGAWGTILQGAALSPADYRGEIFRDHPRDVTGDPDVLNLTRPDVVLDFHRQYLAGLRERGQLAASGPFADDSGALIIYEAASPEEAEKLLQGDPFCQNGIFVKYVLRPWNPVLANRELFPAT